MKMTKVVDLAFNLRGDSIIDEYAEILASELYDVLPWMDQTVMIHPLKRVSRGQGITLISRHTRLLLRLPQVRSKDALVLCGRQIDLGSMVSIGQAVEKDLVPAATIHASFVDQDQVEEQAFLHTCQQQLNDMAINAQLVAGLAKKSGATRGYSLMLAGLSPEDSYRVQSLGLGQGHWFGRGVFIPHKSTVAVGEGIVKSSAFVK